MQPDKIKDAVVEAKRFLKKADEYHRVEKINEWSSPREAGAMRRASMDLTRALADMRKP